MDDVRTIGVDIAKSVFQVHGVGADGAVAIRRRVGRAKVLELFAGLSPCLVGMEACATAHHWARELKKLGHDTRLMPPTYVKAYVKRGKNDAADAAAICEAVTRPSMRFVPIKSVEQQSTLVLHRTRDLLIRQRTQLINALRAHLGELGAREAQRHVLGSRGVRGASATMPNCIVCKTSNTNEQEGSHDGGGFTRYDCRRCGVFVLTHEAQSALERHFAENPLRRSLMSHTLRRMQTPDRKSSRRLIYMGELPTFWNEVRLPTPLEQADNLILWIGDNQPAPSLWARTTVPAISATIGIAITEGGNDGGSLGWLGTQLSKKELYKTHPETQGDQLQLMLEMPGWEKYYEIRKHKVESHTAFMALKFGQAELDRVVDDCFRVAVKRAGFDLRILTDQQGAGLIDNQIRAALLSARFVISDLTHGSPGAYWEAGFGEGRGVPVIYTCEKQAWEEKKSHFDTNHMATIIWDGSELKKAEDALLAMIRATLRGEAKQTDE
jgi:Transposase